MDEDKDRKYVVRPVRKEEPKASLEEEGMSEPSKPAAIPQASKQTKPWQRIQFSQIPTDKIIKTMTNKDLMLQTLHDETMEPHIHLAILLMIVIILAIIITLLGI